MKIYWCPWLCSVGEGSSYEQIYEENQCKKQTKDFHKTSWIICVGKKCVFRKNTFPAPPKTRYAQRPLKHPICFNLKELIGLFVKITFRMKTSFVI